MAIFKSTQVEANKRLIWLFGAIFVVLIAFQYIELPYSNVFSSLLSNGKVPVPEQGRLGSGDSSSTSQIGINSFYLNDVNTNDRDATNNSTGTFGGPGRNNSLLTDEIGDLNSSTEVNQNTLPENRSTSDNFVIKSDGTVPENASEPDPPISFSPDVVPPVNVTEDIRIFEKTFEQNSSLVSVDEEEEEEEEKALVEEERPPKISGIGNSSTPSVPIGKEKSHILTSEVVSISKMKSLLQQSHVSYHSMKPYWSSVVDEELIRAKSQIENAPIVNDPGLYAPLYQNVSMFRRSYELMEQILKVYVYREGKRPVFHGPPLKGIYASEGWFMKLLEANKRFVSKDPRKAHLFYLPFSSRALEETLYVRDSHSHKNLIVYLKKYLDIISGKYPFWNRTGGADHFLVACHDWAPAETREHMSNCIRALCNSDIKEGFGFGKDVSLPETYIRSPQNLLRDVGGLPPSNRNILAFFAGRMHGYLRPILLQHWQNKDPDMKIFGPMPKGKGKGKMTYIQHMKSSKYCICARGYEVNSPRVVEAIFYGCVPVIISDNFVPPLFEILNWESFAVFVAEKDIPNLKNILLSISQRRYTEMQRRVKKVQQHFLWHARPQKYDMFHMILHSIWYNRVFGMPPR